MEIKKLSDEVAEVTEVRKQLVDKKQMEEKKANLLEKIAEIDEFLAVFNTNSK